MRVLAGGKLEALRGQVIRKKFKLGSTDFAVRAMTLDEVPDRALFGTRCG